MKKNIYKVIWISGLFLLLIVMLAMIMTYKIKYQDTIYYKYLYFYNCSDSLCSTLDEKEIDDKSTIYSVYKFYNTTPTFTKLNEDYVQIIDNDVIVLYDYIKGNVISEKYESYTIINNEIPSFITVNNEKKYGIIDSEANVQVDFIYEDIKDRYNDEIIVVGYNSKYGVITLDGKTAILDYVYDDIYIYDDVIITIKDNVLNITDDSKKKLVDDIQIDSIGDVTINRENNILYIKVSKESEFSEYKFDIITKKLV